MPSNKQQFELIMQNKDNLVWLDLEMTGLDIDKERIIEIATIVTDSQLNVLAEGPVLAIHQSDEQLDAMDDWNKKHHGRSGLVDRVKASTLIEADAERETLEFLKQYVDENTSPLCGNSVHVDRMFLRKFMPQLDQFFYYRHLDVSTLKELAKRWAPAVYKSVKKESKHQALDDIKESIEELKHYRASLFRHDDE